MSRAARDWARRAMLSALAGGGLTAAPLTGGALAAEAPSGSNGPAPATSTSPSSEQATGQTTTSTTTSTTPAPTTAPSNAPAATSAPTGTTTTPAPTGTTTMQAPTAPAADKQAGVVLKGSHAQPSGPAHREASHHSQAPKRHVRGGHPTSAGRHARKPSSGGVSSPTTTASAAPSAPSIVASSNIAPAPALAASQLTPSPLLSGSLASMQALSFYRVPLFLLPIYQAAATQYGVPWQILAAINEVETDYGTDLSVSTAGAVGWMQFMPETWLQYGVDAVNAGYADPYNPVDAIFAAARYLHAAGAGSDLRGAIFSYNHSDAYVQSVLLRARLIASYPASVIGTLTGLTEGNMPVAGATLLSNAQETSAAGAEPQPGLASPGQAASSPSAASGLAPAPAAASSSLPGSTPAPAPATSAAKAAKAAEGAAPLAQLSELAGPAGAPVLAVEDGRIVEVGRSRRLGRYIVLRDTYGDVFTYASLGSIVPSYRLPKPAPLEVPKGSLRGAQQPGAGDPAPTQAATAGSQLPLTLHVAAKKAVKGATATAAGASAGSPVGSSAGSPVAPEPVGAGKVRLFAHPGNRDALAAARAQAARSRVTPAGWLALTRGSLVAQGTVLGHLGASREEPAHGYLRFAVRPAGSQAAVDPAPILENWRQLDVALHPQGAKGGDVLAGATAGDAFLLSHAELEHAVLSDPGIRLSACDRHQVANGKVDEHMLALLVLLSRSGLKPTVGELRCGRISYTPAGPLTTYLPGGSFTLTAINGVPVSGHQGPGTITDVAIRTLLTAKPPFAPRRIVSLMQYPGVASTVAAADHSDAIEVALRSPAAGRRAPHASARLATSRSVASAQTSVTLDSTQWHQLMARIGGLARPRVSRKPSSAAIRDLRH